MKNTLTLLLLILFSTLTAIVTANESREASTESCNTNYTLPDDQWRQVSLPCVPAGSGSVADVFGDDMVDAFGADTPAYNTNWVVYKYDLSIDGGYIKLEESAPLSVGVGYWIIQQSGHDATLDLPANSQPASVVQSAACPSDNGCFEIQLKTKAAATGWNMIGRPAHFSSTLGDVNVQTSTEACEGGCDLNAAESKSLVHNHLWTYDETSYTQVINPDGTLEAWVGYWAATLDSADLSNPKLLIPKADSLPLPENPLSGRVTATTGVELNGVTVKVLKNGAEQNITTTTNAEGKFGLSLDPESEYTLSFTASGYANQVQRVKTPLAGQEVNLDVVLTPRGEIQTVADMTSVTLTGTDGATVSLNPQFVDSQGNAVTAGDGIKLTITPVDVSTPAGIAAFPGDFAGVPEGQSDASPIVSYGTVEYQFTRASDGEELQLKTGEQADIQIPIYTKKHQDGTAIKAGDSIPLWSLNEATGLWAQEGTGTVVASTNSPTGFALQAAVSHFSWWNCDVTMNPANAIVTVNAPEAGTALIKARTDADIGWRPNTVDTVITVGASTEPLFIPSNGEVCFWAEVNFTSGNSATTPESCVTAAPNATVNVTLEIQGGALGLVANPDENVTAYINSAAVQTKIQPTTSEEKVSYVLESGALPAGVTLTSINDTTAVISGVPTEAGSFSPVIKGTDTDGNTATVALSYTVIDVGQPITREQLDEMIKNGEDITQVNTSQITDMSRLFYGVSTDFRFGVDLSRWDVSNVTDMSFMFVDSSRYEQNPYFYKGLNSWDVSNVTNMSYMFSGGIARQLDISEWDVSSVTNMAGMFRGYAGFNGDISRWDVSNVTDMSSMFSHSYYYTNGGWEPLSEMSFNQDIGDWDISSVTSISWMFQGASSFNQDIGSWNVSNVIEMYSVFSGASSFNQDISHWDVSNVTKMNWMFGSALSFNQDIGGWDVSSATDLSGMFYRASSFNQDIGSWNVSNASDMGLMFYRASSFNQNIGDWDVSSVADMQLMFSRGGYQRGDVWVSYDEPSFNQDISSWDVSNVSNMTWMFEGASSFNQDISSWDVSNVTDMNRMFRFAESFTNQDLSGWNVSKVTTHYQFFEYTGPGNIEPNWPSAESITNEDFNNPGPDNTEANWPSTPE